MTTSNIIDFTNGLFDVKTATISSFQSFSTDKNDLVTNYDYIDEHDPLLTRDWINNLGLENTDHFINDL